VGAIAERLVLRLPAAAKIIMFGRGPRALLGALEFHAALDGVGTVGRHVNKDLSESVAVFSPIQGVAESARGTALYRLDDLLNGCAVGIDPRLCSQLEYGF